MSRRGKIFLGAAAGVAVGAGVVTTRRPRRAPEVELGAVATLEPEPPCEHCGSHAGYRERQGTRLEQDVVHGGRLRNPVLQDRKIFFTYHACRECGAVR
jgi:hypothetical protein